MKTVPEMLRDAAGIYEQRNKLYGDNYKRFGAVFESLLGDVQFYAKPNADYLNRLGILVQMISKMTRYIENFNRGGHEDSLDDLAVYSMMLKELDNELKVRAVEKERGK